MRFVTVLLAALLVTSCGETTRTRGTSSRSPRDSGMSTTPGNDAGPGQDAGPASDAGVICACDVTPNSCDAQCACDPLCGPVDTGTPDAGGPADSGSPTDSGAPDTGTPDAGTPDTGTPDAGTPPPSDPMVPAVVSVQQATAECRFRSRCEPAYYDFYQETEADCIAERTAGFMELYTLKLQAIQNGRAGFSARDFNACIAAVNNSTCDTLWAPAVCDRDMIGTQTPGQGCFINDECVAGSSCILAASGASCGTCVANVGMGQACDTAQCAPGLDCFNVGQALPVCLSNSLLVGAACGTVQTGLCRSPLQCVNERCTIPAGPGAMCDLQQMSNPDCDILQRSTCANNRCVGVTWGGPGTICGVPESQCTASSGGCDPGTQRCSALPGIGQECLADCQAGAWCEFNPNGADTCRPLVPTGGACSDRAACTGADTCTRGTCQPAFYNVCN